MSWSAELLWLMEQLGEPVKDPWPRVNDMVMVITIQQLEIVHPYLICHHLMAPTWTECFELLALKRREVQRVTSPSAS